MEARSIAQQPDTEAYAQRAYELWQQMAPRWEQGRETLWATTRPVAEWLVDRLDPQPGQTVLELAAGAGETGFLAAGRLGDEGRLISSDFAPNMVEVAKRVGEELGVTNAEFRVLDAGSLELEDASVDGVICRMGYMLMPDAAQALRETRRVLRDGGRLVFAVFGGPQHNPWMTLARGVMVDRGHLEPPNPNEPGMFSMSEPEMIRALLQEAGFERSEVAEIELAFRFRDADAMWDYVSELQGPIALAIARLDDEERAAIRAAMEKGFEQFRKDGGYELPGLTLNVLAS